MSITAFNREVYDANAAGGSLSSTPDSLRESLSPAERSRLKQIEEQLAGTGLSVDVERIVDEKFQNLLSDLFDCSKLKETIASHITKVIQLFPEQSIDDAIKMLVQILWRSKSPSEFLILSQEGAMQMIQVLTNTSKVLGTAIALQGSLDLSALPQTDRDARTIVSELFRITGLTNYYSIRLLIKDVDAFSQFAVSCSSNQTPPAQN